MKNYQQLLDLIDQNRTLLSIESLLNWDQETYMPKMGLQIRKKHFQIIATLRQERLINPKFRKLLESCIGIKTKKFKNHLYTLEEKRTLLWIRKDFLIAQALPKEFVADYAQFQAEAIAIWSEARKKNDFSLFAPYLEKTIDFSLKKAGYIDSKKDPHNVLIDLYEPNMTKEELDSLFFPLKQQLSSLLETILPKRKKSTLLRGYFSKNTQMDFFHNLLPLLGFDLSKGRLDLSNHPFSLSLNPLDSRITTRIYEDNLLEGLSAVLHEVGHGLYEMGLDPNAKDAKADSLSLGVHESQSRFYETCIGQSAAFAKFLLPFLKKYFLNFEQTSPEELFLALNQVESSYIRVEADEITYSFHIILRHELEKALLEKTLSVKDLPEAWNEKMQKYLGITPPTNQQGCLQDIHWAMGDFGYFPTYALGNFIAAQLFETMQMTYPDWESRIASNDLIFIKDFLHEKIHRFGRVFTQQELLQNACKCTLSTENYISYLSKKYKKIYS